MSVISDSYDTYFSSGLYHKRYPNINPNVARRILPFLSKSKRVLDFGCGIGRYTQYLLDNSKADITCFDVCHQAIDAIRKNFDPSRITTILDDESALSSLESFDLILSLFGVISHIGPASKRLGTLKMLSSLLRDNSESSIIITVPNKFRRFYKNQVAHILNKQLEGHHFEPGDIIYHRVSESKRIPLFYHLYSRNEFVRDIQAAGITPNRLFAESFFAERFVSSYPCVAKLDYYVCSMLPSVLCYGHGVIGSRSK